MALPIAAIQENTSNFFSIEVACATFLVLEYFQNLPSEVALVWPDRLGLLKGLFFLNRYCTTLGTLFGLMFEIGSMNASFQLCKWGIYIQALVMVLNLAWSETILFVRVYALSKQNPFVGVFLTSLWTGILAGLMVAYHGGVTTVKFLPHVLPGHACLPLPSANKVLRTLPFFLILTEQILIMVLCVFFRLDSFWSSRNRLARTFSRDGLYYFFAITLMSIANVAFSLAFLDRFDHYLGPPQAAVQSALATRLVLHLRKAKADQDFSALGIQHHHTPIELHDRKPPSKAHGDLKSFLP